MSPNDVQPGSSPAPVLDENLNPGSNPNPESEPGSKTPAENQLAAIHEERRMRKEAEERARVAEEALQQRQGLAPSIDDEEWSDEGKMIIEKHLKPLQETVSRLTEQLSMKDIFEKYPALKDKQSEFNEFRSSHPTYSSEDAAKIFLADNGLLAPNRRKGIEEPRGGQRTPPSVGMTTADIEHLRKTDYKRYLKLLEEGKIKLDGNDQ